MIKAGCAQAVITPPKGVYLCGYPNTKERANVGVLLDLKTKVLVLDDGNEKAAIITNDLIGIRSDLVKRIRDRITDVTGIPANRILISCSHTHSGPNMAYEGEFFCGPEYIDSIVETMSAAAAEAIKDLTPVTVGTGTGEADLCHNRRVLDENGKSSSGWEDHGHEHTGITDHRVFVLEFKAEDGTPKAILAGYCCHPVVMGPPNNKVSSDYPGYLQAYLETALPGCQAMFFNAGGGNANPYVCIGNDDNEARKMGEALGKEVERVLPGIATDDPDRIAAKVVPVSMAPNPKPGEKLKKRLKDTKGRVETEVQLMEIGDILIVTAPGELLVEIALKIKEVSGAKETLVFAYSNGSHGYLPPPEICEQGGYEVDSAQTHEFQPAVVKALQEHAGMI